MEDRVDEVADAVTVSTTEQQNFSQYNGFWDRVVTAKIPLGIPLKPLPYPNKISRIDWIRRCIYTANGPIPDDWTFLWPNPKSELLNQLMIPMVLANSRGTRFRKRVLRKKKEKEKEKEKRSWARPLSGPITEQEIPMVARKHVVRMARPAKAKLTVKDLPKKKKRTRARKKKPPRKRKRPTQDPLPDSDCGGEACKKFITRFVLVRNSPHSWSIVAKG